MIVSRHAAIASSCASAAVVAVVAAVPKAIQSRGQVSENKEQKHKLLRLAPMHILCFYAGLTRHLTSKINIISKSENQNAQSDPSLLSSLLSAHRYHVQLQVDSRYALLHVSQDGRMENENKSLGSFPIHDEKSRQSLSP